MQEAFVIIDAKNAALHLVRTDPPLVVSIETADLESLADVLVVPEGLDELQSLFWVANLLTSGDRDPGFLPTLQEKVQSVGEFGDACVALRYQDWTLLLDLIIRRKRSG